MIPLAKQKKQLENRITELEKQEKIEIVQNTDIISLNSGYSFVTGSYPIFKQGKHYWGYILIKKDSGTFTRTQEKVGSFKIPILGAGNTFCSLSTNEWKSQSIGYFYFNVDITISDENNNGYNTAKAYIDVVTK